MAKTDSEEVRREKSRLAVARYREKHRERLKRERLERYHTDGQGRKIDAKYRAENREKLNEKMRRYRELNREKVKRQRIEQYYRNGAGRARNAKYREVNRQKINEQALRRDRRNREKRNAQQRTACAKPDRREKQKIRNTKYRENNAEKIRAYRKENRVLLATYTAKRRAKVLSVGGSHTGADILELFAKQGGKCAACKCKITIESGKFRFHVDHVNPIARGGSNNPDNLQLLCRKCNRIKSAKTPEEWAEENGLLFC